MTCCSNSSAACIRTDSRRRRPVGVSPPPSAYLTHHGYSHSSVPVRDFKEIHPDEPKSVTSVTPKHAPVGTAWATLQARGIATAGSVVLTSYARGEAAAKMGELKAALTTCKEVSTSSRRGWSARASIVALPSVSVGDESVSYSETSAEAPGKGRVTTIVRTGGSMAVYLIPVEVNGPPASLMNQQHKKIQAAR